jgi:hypothetical protein
LGAYEERARAEAERAESDRIAAEAEANRSQIEAQAEAEAARIQAEAAADAERARAEAERVQAQAEADRAASEIQRALGDRAISEAVAENVRSTSRQAELMTEAQVRRLEADVAKTTAESYATYALMAIAGVLALGFAVFLVQAGAALYRRSRSLSAPYKDSYQVLDVSERRRGPKPAFSGSSSAGWPVRLACWFNNRALELERRQ